MYAMNNPNITAIILITFFSAYPVSNPPINPPPPEAEIEIKHPCSSTKAWIGKYPYLVGHPSKVKAI
jgi:hypothetical protein